LGCLPLNFDKNEGLIQHEMLADLIIINPKSVIGNEGENMPRVIELFALILDGKANNETVT